MENQNVLELGVVLGQNQAFGLVAGRCSAAQAEALCRLRNEKLYKPVCDQWNEFCPDYLKMSGTQADKIIRLWEEFGAGYFEMAQITRVSPETYRELAPSVENGVLHLGGEPIEITMENSRRVARAVSEVRQSLAAARKPEGKRTIEQLAQLCTCLAEEFERMQRDSQQNHSALRLAVYRLTGALDELRTFFNL